ncbi:MAG TPA: hypothetical protein VF230_07230 [Acidimicrobiales bacterium]
MNEQRAREGVEHLQAAALEVIAAAKAFLDVAEDLVRDPAGANALAADIVDFARRAADAAAPRTPSSTPAPAAGGDGRDPADGTGVTRIRVS